MCERLESRRLLATFHVSAAGDDLADGSDSAPFRSIQRGLDAAVAPGDTVLVHEGRYAERVAFRAGGSARGGPVTLAASPGARPVIDVGGLDDGAEHVITIRDLGHVVVRGFEIVGNEARAGGAAVWVRGAGTGIEIRDNVIHDLRGVNSMGIAVFGTRRLPIRDLTIADNVLHDVAAAPSEALVVSGILLSVEPAARRNRLDGNRYRLGVGAAVPTFQWRGRTFASLTVFTAVSGQDRRSTLSAAG